MSHVRRAPGTANNKHCCQLALVGSIPYVTSETGTTFVIKAADRFELVARNEIEEQCLACPIVCHGQLYLRTAGSLYCIGRGE